MYPILLQLDIFGYPLRFYSYGTMLSLSFVVSIVIALKLVRRDGYPKNFSINTFIMAIVGSLVGARILYVLTNLDDFSDGFPLSILDFKNRDGMVAYGGYLGGIIISWWYLSRRGLSLFRFGDGVAPLLALGLGFTRIGCLLAGCDYGKPTDLPIGISFPKGSFAYSRHLRERLITAGNEWSLPVFPTQPAESLTGFLLFGILLWFHIRKRKHAGQTLALFLFLYGVARFLIEFARGDEGRGGVGFFSTSQWIALITAAFAVWIYFKRFPITEEKTLAAIRLAEEREEKKKSASPFAGGKKKK
ncbi:MAG: prolipoprotein diacylglyceryl transferase [Myxococcota bacterium]